MTFVFWWPVLYGLVLLAVLVLWVKTDNRNQRTGVRNQKSENRGQKNPVRASGRDAREITSIRREAALFDWGPGRPFFLSRYGVRRTPVQGRGTPGAHAQCLPAGRRDIVAEAMWRATPS